MSPSCVSTELLTMAVVCVRSKQHFEKIQLSLFMWRWRVFIKFHFACHYQKVTVSTTVV